MLATVRSDGSPATTACWFEVEITRWHTDGLLSDAWDYSSTSSAT